QTKQTNSVSFLTAPDVTLASNIISPLDSGLAAVVNLPANTLSPGAFVVPRVQFLNPTGFLSRAGGPSSVGVQGALQPFSKPAEIIIYPCPASNPNCPASAGAVMLTMKPLSNNAALASANKSTLGIYTLNSQGA